MKKRPGMNRSAIVGNEMRSTIYCLVDPRQPDIYRYVGKTQSKTRERLRKHRQIRGREREKTHRGHWIAKIQSEGVEPNLVVLLRVKTEHENEAEREMIVRLRAAGHPLTNGRPGGEGGALPPDLLARALETKRIKRAAGLYAKSKVLDPIMPIRLRPTHTSYAIYPVSTHNAPCHIEGTGRMGRT